MMVKCEENDCTTKKKKQMISSVTPLVHYQPGTKWYIYSDGTRVEQPNCNLDHLKKVEEYAELLLRKDVELYGQMQHKKNPSETAWLNTILNRGTAADKVTAMQLLVQHSAVHSLPHIATLVEVVAKKNIRQAFSLLDLLKNLFITELLPPKRKLIFFSMRPVDDVNMSLSSKNRTLIRKLILWKYESELKTLYGKFVSAIERLAGGSVEKLCILACRCALQLLLERPEQEQMLLSLLVNKLGHPSRTVATRVCGYLLQLTRKQPLLRPFVVKEVERLLYRKNIACRAQLHAITFLSQIDLDRCDSELASDLLKIYIGLFRMLVSNEKLDDKILTTVLIATNRAFPYAKGEADKLAKEVDILYKILHQSNFSTALQTLKLLYQLLTTSQGISDRFYAALYRRILDIQHSANFDRQLFALLYQALSSDTADCRVIAYIKRLLQLATCRNAPFAAASLILIARLVEEKPLLLVTKKAAHGPFPSKSNKSCESDDDEIYKDYDSSAEDIKASVTSKFGNDKGEPVDGSMELVKNRSGGWVHRNNIVLKGGAEAYDPLARNPLFARADRCIASELTLLSKHYHPSVAVFASNLLNGISVRYDGDPLLDFTQMHFLNRFVFRNPKKKDRKEVVQRKVHDGQHDVRKLPVTSMEYAVKNRDEIPIAERFLHRFVSAKMPLKKENAISHFDDDIESVNSDEFDMLLDHFEPGEQREVFNVDFSQEFSTEKKKKVKGQKRSIDDSTIRRENKKEGRNGWMDAEQVKELDESYDEGDESELEPEDSVEEQSSENESIQQIDKRSDDLDSDFSEQLDFEEDAALSADKLVAVLEEDDEAKEMEKAKRKIKKPRGFKKRRWGLPQSN